MYALPVALWAGRKAAGFLGFVNSTVSAAVMGRDELTRCLLILRQHELQAASLELQWDCVEVMRLNSETQVLRQACWGATT